MKVFNTDGSLLMEVKTLERNGNRLEFQGVVMGTMPVKGQLSPTELRRGMGLVKGIRMWWFLLTMIFRRG